MASKLKKLATRLAPLGKKTLLYTCAMASGILFVDAGLLPLTEWWWYWILIGAFIFLGLMFDWLLKQWYVPRTDVDAKDTLRKIHYLKVQDELEKAFEDTAPNMGVDFYTRLGNAAITVIKREM